MTEPEHEEQTVDTLVRRALGDFVPTSEAAVERAEAEGVEYAGALPEQLSRFRGLPASVPVAAPSAPKLLSLDDARRARAGTEAKRAAGGRSILSHAAVGFASAAAAALLLVATRSTPQLGAGRDAPPSASVEVALPERIVIDSDDACPAACCAGSACQRASADLRECPSGRACISCAQPDLAAGAYRFRIGGFAPAEKFRKSLAAGPLEVCLRVAGSELVCGPSHTAGDTKKWTELPLPVTSGDTLGGVTVAVRFAGAKEALAEWSEPLSLNAGGLCKGYLIQPMFRTGEPLGTLSAFLVDSHYVELGRAATIEPLRRERSRYDTSLELHVFETQQPGADRFTLALGPFGKAQAERVRWKILERGGNATTSVGGDYTGDGLLIE